MEKLIELTPLAEIGKGIAKITDCSVEIEISGIIGGLKAWLIGGEAEPIGNIVDGKLCKRADTTKHNGILITQSGRQMMIGKYAEEEQKKQESDLDKQAPFEIPGFTWKKITQKKYGDLCEEIRYILSNASVYNNYKKHGYYWVGDAKECGALALACDQTENNPLEFLGESIISKNGYVLVCVNKKTKKIYIP